jgi:hypothetical protein
MKVKVHYVSRYDVPDRERGGRVTGIKCQYQTGEAVADHTGRGQPVLTVGGDESLWSCFSQVPGVYDLTMTVKPDAKGKAVMYLVDVNPVNSPQ